MKPKIAKVVVGLPVEGPFDYQIDKELQSQIAVGQRVRVAFNRRNCLGFIIGTAQRSHFKQLNPILSLLDNAPIMDEPALALAEEISAYYGCSLGEAMETYLPPVLRRDKVQTNFTKARTKKTKAGESKTILIHDHTRHQRWGFIAENIKDVIKKKKSVIVLVPELAFVEEAVSVLKKLDCPMAVCDKKLTPKNELAQWEDIKKGTYSLIVGVRSAVFAPLPNLGLIVMNDEDNEAYKQEQTPHYHAKKVAQMRAHIEHCPMIFANSVPSAEIWEEAKRNNWERIVLEEEGKSEVQIVDMSNYNPGKTSILSFPLQNAIQKTLERREKIVLFLNRKGFSTRTHCQQCGYTVKCARCNVNLSYLYAQKIMICRHCNYKMEFPKICPQCNGSYLRSTGIGVEKLESEVARLYPQAKIHRYDSVTKPFKKNSDIIIATQSLFRLHEQWRASLVGILNIDDQMHYYDFRSGQKTFSLLVHLRQLTRDQMMIQTRMGENYCLQTIREMDFAKFYREELKLRRELKLPPYRHLVELCLRGKNENVVLDQSNKLFEDLMEEKPKGIEISDPHPDVNPKLRDQYRYTILLKGRQVKGILALIKSVLKEFKKRSVIITVNVDP